MTPKLYIETSTFNFFYSKESKKQAETRKLFDWIAEGRFEPYTSNIVMDELNNASTEKREKMLNILQKYGIIIIKADNEARTLADIYVSKGIIPQKYDTDALHIAIATVNRLNFVVSHNFGHIVKLKTLNMTGLANVRRDYPQIRLFSPGGGKRR
jgi:predicted nucleic acid-binding protein